MSAPESLFDALQEHVFGLDHMSYHGAPWDLGETTWMADLTKDDIEQIAALMRRCLRYIAAAEEFRDSFTKPAPATFLAVRAMDEA